MIEFIMTLNELREEIIGALTEELSDWNVATSAIPFASDLLVEVIWLDTTLEMVEMSQAAIKGNLGIVLYRKFGESYDEMVDAIESIAKLLPTLTSFDGVAIGNQTSTLAQISSPSVTSDGRVDYRAVIIAIPVEVLI